MPTQSAGLVELVARLIDTLESGPLPYAFGGAIALSAWAEPRATIDIDLNLWADLAALDQAFDLLGRAGVNVDRRAAKLEADTRGMFVGRSGGVRVDVFVPSVPFYAEALANRRRVRLAGRQTWVLSAETLAVFKLLFFRAKDLVDLERLVAVQGPNLDTEYVRRHVTDMMGEDDERVARWDTIAGSAARD